MKPAVSLIIAVYNAVRYLELIFEALGRQSMTGFEVIVADDGSGPGIAGLVERERARGRFPVRHLWHEDAGFRKNVMLNLAIRESASEYLVFIDGDCVPHRDFLRDHAATRQPGRVLCGRRVNLGKSFSERLTAGDVASGAIERLSLKVLADGIAGRSTNLEDGIRIGSPWLRKLLSRREARILGCNFSVEKSLLVAVNGFDEDYRAPGRGEDSDIAFRLELIGARLEPLRNFGIVYHLWHPPTVVGEVNRDLHERVMRERNPVCRNGLVKHPGSG